MLNTLAREGRLVPGTVLVFDELCNYCGCEKHEWRALFELAEETGIRFQWLGIQNKGCMKAALVFCARGQYDCAAAQNSGECVCAPGLGGVYCGAEPHSQP